MKTACTERRGRAAFTLIELLAVMALILLIVSLAIGGYVGMVRSRALASSLTNVRGALTQARSYAMTFNRRTYVVFMHQLAADRRTNAVYYVCAHEGTHQKPAGDVLWVESKRWRGVPLVGRRIHNFTRGTYGQVVWDNSSSDGNQLRAVDSASRSGAMMRWLPGDKCGMEVHQREFLPPTVLFAPETVGKLVIFNPDGSTPLRSMGTITVKMVEDRPTSPGGSERGWCALEIKGLTGLIRVTRGVDI